MTPEELKQKKEENIRKLNRMLGMQVLLESMLYTHICDNFEFMKKVNPTLANICRNDLNTLHRNHEFYASKFRKLTNIQLIHDYESLKEILERFLVHGNDKETQ